MIVIFGLGNPGKKYENTRHNVGFMVVDAFAEKNNFPEFKFSKKINALFSENIFDRFKIVLVKPQTYMNESGKAAKKIIGNWELEIRNLFVAHDDIDLPLGKIKISVGRGAAGHKGVESIIKNLGTNRFTRIRIGILPKRENPKNPEKFVLQKITKDEKKILEEVIQKTVEAIELSLKEGAEKAMNVFNK